MAHNHSVKSTRKILEHELYECSCGARKWSHGQAILGGVLDGQGWYTPEEPQETKEEIARRNAIEMLETEGYGYDYNQQETNDPLDSHDPRNAD